MGYECGFNAIRRFKDISFEEMKNTLNYLEWKNNPWNFEDDHYPTYEKYWNAFIKNDFFQEDIEEYPGEPDEEKIEFYQQLVNSNHTLGSWCSIGFSCLDTYMTNNLTQVKHTEDWIGVDEEFVRHAKNWTYSELKEYDLIHVYPTNSIKFVEDDEDSFIISKIDGVEMKDDDDKVYRIYNEYESPLCYCVDEEKRYCLESFIQTLDFIKFLQEQGDYFIWFWRSY